MRTGRIRNEPFSLITWICYSVDVFRWIGPIIIYYKMGTNRPLMSPPKSNAEMAKQLDCYDTLKLLSSDELRQIMDNEERVHSLIIDSPLLIKLSDQKQDMIAENVSIAEYNLQREKEMQEARECLYRSHSVLSDKQKEFDKFKKQHDMLMGGPGSNLDLLFDNLQIAASKADDESEKLAQEFLDGDKSIEVFLSEYLAKRLEVHIKTIKAEKLGRLLSSGSANTQQTFY